MNPPKPVALKKLEGTYREDRDGGRAVAETAIHNTAGVLFEKGVKVRVPKSIHTKYVKAYWRKLTAMLIELRTLSPADLPQLEVMCVVLEQLRSLQVILSGDPPDIMGITPLDEGYDKIIKTYIALSNKFDSLASKYYVSPEARIRLKLDALTAVKAEQDVIKGSDAISAILGGRK